MTEGHPSLIMLPTQRRVPLMSAVGTNPNLPSHLRAGRVITGPSAIWVQHCNSATPEQLNPLRSALQQLHDIGLGQPRVTRADRPPPSGLG
jgi:hypothetical protein